MNPQIEINKKIEKSVADNRINENHRADFPAANSPHKKSVQAGAKSMNQIRTEHSGKNQAVQKLRARLSRIRKVAKKINHRLKRAKAKPENQRRQKKLAEIQIFARNKSNQKSFYQLLRKPVAQKKFEKNPAQTGISGKKLLRRKARKIKLKESSRQNRKKSKQSGEQFR